jgi:hypothetical protein
MNICMFDELVVESGPHVVAEVLQDLDTATEVVNELRSKPDDQTDGVCQVVGETMIGKLPEVVENDNKVMESLLGRTLSHGELPAYVAENPGGEMGETDHDKAPGKNEGRARKRRLSIVWRASRKWLYCGVPRVLACAWLRPAPAGKLRGRVAREPLRGRLA